MNHAPMSDGLAQLTSRLERLVKLIMAETDTAKYDELAAEIWRVLGERESLVRSAQQPPHHSAPAK